ncbi:MAG: hypothetical protein P8Z76_19805, partial [Alphaproteobacteria bacterium]
KDKGEKLKASKMQKMLSSLEEKKARYQGKLNTDMGEKDRHILKIKLQVIDTQIDKLSKMISDQQVVGKPSSPGS